MLCGCGQKEEKNVDLHQLIHTMETVVDFGNTTEDDLTHQEVASLYGILLTILNRAMFTIPQTKKMLIKLLS